MPKLSDLQMCHLCSACIVLIAVNPLLVAVDKRPYRLLLLRAPRNQLIQSADPESADSGLDHTSSSLVSLIRRLGSDRSAAKYSEGRCCLWSVLLSETLVELSTDTSYASRELSTQC